MKVVQLLVPGGPENLRYVELPTPELVDNSLRVEALAVGVGRPDVMIRTGKYKWMPALPAVIGNEMVGRVVEVGRGADAGWMHRLVLVSARELDTRGGCYAEQMVVPADALIPLPDGLDPLAAVTLPNHQLAWGLLHDATRGRLPTSVYLNGAAGGVGSAVIQLCVQLDIRVWAGASTEAKRHFALNQGASGAVDTGADDATLIASVMEATQGRGVDLVLDHACGPRCAAHLDMLAAFGTLVSYNAIAGLPDTDVFAKLRGHANKALSVAAYNMHAYNGPSMRGARRGLMDTPMRWLEQGRLRPAIDATLPLSQVQHAHERLDARDILGKLVLVP